MIILEPRMTRRWYHLCLVLLLAGVMTAEDPVAAGPAVTVVDVNGKAEPWSDLAANHPLAQLWRSLAIGGKTSAVGTLMPGTDAAAALAACRSLWVKVERDDEGFSWLVSGKLGERAAQVRRELHLQEEPEAVENQMVTLFGRYIRPGAERYSDFKTFSARVWLAPLCGLSTPDERLASLHLTWTGRPTATGLDDRVELAGLPLVAEHLDADALAGLPEDAWAAVALPIDGSALSALPTTTAQLPVLARARVGVAALLDASGVEVGPWLATATGTVTVGLLPTASDTSGLMVGLPAGPAWDRLINGVCARLGSVQPPAEGSMVRVPLPAGSPWSMLEVERRGGRWLACTVPGRLASATVAPSWAASWTTAAGGTRVDLRRLGRELSKGSLAQRLMGTRPPWLATIGLTLGRQGWVTSATVAVTASGATLAGDGAVVGVAALSLAGYALLDGLAQVGRAAVRPELEARLRSAATADTTALTGGPLPAGLPPIIRPWLAQVAALRAHDPSQPLAVLAPEVLGGVVWFIDDRGLHETTSDGVALWRRAEALAARGGPATWEDWAETLDALRARTFAGPVAGEDVDENWRVLALPAGWVRSPPPRERNEDSTDGLWTGGKDQALALTSQVVPLPERGALEHAVVLVTRGQEADGNWKVVASTAAWLDGLPARYLDTRQSGPAVWRRLLLVTEYGGRTFTLVSAGKADQPALIKAGLDLLSDRFVRCDRHLPAVTDASLRHRDWYAQPSLPVVVSASGGWLLHPRPAELAPNAALVLTRPDRDAWALVAALPKVGEVPPGALAAAARALVNFNENSESVDGEQRATLAGATGCATRFVRLGESQRFTMQCRAAVLGGQVVLAVAYQTDSPDGESPELTELLDNIAPAAETPSATHAPAVAVAAEAIAEWLGTHGHQIEALPWAKAAADAAPDDLARQRRVLLYCGWTGRWDEGLAWYDAHATVLDTTMDLAVFRAWLQGNTSATAAAIAGYEQLFDRGLDSDDDFNDLLRLYRQDADRQRALAAFVRWPLLGERRAGQRLHARVQREAGQTDAATAWISELVRRAPDDEGLRTLLLDHLLFADQNAAAQEATVAATARLPAAARLWYLRGVAEHRLGRYQEALTSLRRSRDLDPTDDEAKRWHEAVQGDLGRGDASALSRQLQPVSWSCSATPAAPVGEPPGGAYLLREELLAWDPVEGLRQTSRRVVQITDRSACDRFASLQFSFRSEWEDLRIVQVRVTGPDGRSDDVLRLEDCYVLDDRSRGLDDRGKVANVPVPGLRPGCILDFTTTRRERAATAPFRDLPLCSDLPVRRAVVAVQGATTAFRVEVGGGARRADRDGALVVEVEDVPAVRGLAVTPADGKDLPHVTLAAQDARWADLGAEYLRELEPYLRPDATLVATARRLTASATAAADPAGSLLAEVQRQLSYRAVMFGKRARIPQPAASICERTQGDCKDHALLLWHYLRGVGLPAHLALVNSDGITPDLPDLDQFNHMVVALPTSTGWRILDGTAKFQDLALPVPAGLGDVQALVLDPDAPRLITTPPYIPSQLRVQRQTAVAPDGTLTCTDQVTFAGYFAQSWRNRLDGLGDDERRGQLQYAMSGSCERVDSVTVLGDDDGGAVRLAVVWTPRTRLRHADGALTGDLPEPWSDWLLRFAPEPERTRPIDMRYHLSIAIDQTITGPGLAITAAPLPADDRDPFMTWHATSEPQSAGWLARIVIEQLPGRHPVTAFPALTARSATLLERTVLRVRAAAVAAVRAQP